MKTSGHSCCRIAASIAVLACMLTACQTRPALQAMPARTTSGTNAKSAPRPDARTEHLLDREQAELRQTLAGRGVDVTRRGHQLQLVLPATLLFAPDALQPRPDAADIAPLPQLIGLMHRHTTTRLQVTVHTDGIGGATANQALALARAQSLAALFNAAGIVSGRLDVIGAGENSPVADNATVAGRQSNRRIELLLSP